MAMTSHLRLADPSSVHSCWPGVTISWMGRFPVASSLRKADICWVTIAARDSAFSVLSCPRSMRLATSTSAQRVSRDMRPASRRYVRTTSLGSSAAPGAKSRSRLLKRSEEHTSELQSHSDLVCRLLLEKKKKQKKKK